VDTIPAGAGPAGNAGAAATAVASHGWPALANAFMIGRKPLELQQTQNFNVTLNWTTIQPVTTTVNGQAAAGLPVRLYLDGFLKRIVQ
jgi:hypothetical protein